MKSSKNALASLVLAILAIIAMASPAAGQCRSLAEVTGQNTLYNAICVYNGLPTDGTVGMTRFRSLAKAYADTYYNATGNGVNNLAILHAKLICDSAAVQGGNTIGQTQLGLASPRTIATTDTVYTPLEVRFVRDTVRVIDTITVVRVDTVVVTQSSNGLALTAGDTVAFSGRKAWVYRKGTWVEMAKSTFRREADAIMGREVPMTVDVAGPRRNLFVIRLVPDTTINFQPQKRGNRDKEGLSLRDVVYGIAPACLVHPSKAAAKPAKKPKPKKRRRRYRRP